MPRSRQNILLNFKLKNEASTANLNKNKRIFKCRPFSKTLGLFLFYFILFYFIFIIFFIELHTILTILALLTALTLIKCDSHY